MILLNTPMVYGYSAQADLKAKVKAGCNKKEGRRDIV